MLKKITQFAKKSKKSLLFLSLSLLFSSTAFSQIKIISSSAMVTDDPQFSFPVQIIESTGTVTYSLTGDDFSRFSISDTGIITFRPEELTSSTPPTYQPSSFASPTPTNGAIDSNNDWVYEFTINATDDNDTTTKNFKLYMSYPKVVFNPGILPREGFNRFVSPRFHKSGNHPAGQLYVGKIDFDHSGALNSNLTYTITGGDDRYHPDGGENFIIDQSGYVYFNSAVNGASSDPYDTNYNDKYDIDFTVSNTYGFSKTYDFDIDMDYDDTNIASVTNNTPLTFNIEAETDVLVSNTLGQQTQFVGDDANLFTFFANAGLLEFNSIPTLDMVGNTYNITIINHQSLPNNYFTPITINVTAATQSVEDNILNNIRLYVSKEGLHISNIKEGNTQLTMYDISGKQIFSKKFIAHSNNTLSIPKLTTGIYVVNLENAFGKLTKKIVIIN